MTYTDIYTKFQIEYDKAGASTSYPSLTKYEIATILDKAYLALIAQKTTGANTRRIGFEGDQKAIQDVRGLIVTTSPAKSTEIDGVQNKDIHENEFVYDIPDDLIYYVSGTITDYKYNHKNIYGIEADNAIDNRKHYVSNCQFITHSAATNFYSTPTNLPWIKQPVLFMNGNKFHILVDPYIYQGYEDLEYPELPRLNVTYVKNPVKFVDTRDDWDSQTFELSDDVAEQLITLAIVFAAETVESPKMQSSQTLLQAQP